MSDDLCDRSQAQFISGFTGRSVSEKRIELSHLFHDLVNAPALRDTDLAAPLQSAFDDLHRTLRLEREHERANEIDSNLEQALKSASG